MACKSCIEALKNASLVLFELSMLHPEQLPPETDWLKIATDLKDLTVHLTHHHDTPIHAEHQTKDPAE